MQSNRSRTVRQGLMVGLIAYAAVALFYMAFDVLAARGVFFTVDLLGKALFGGVRDPALLQLPVELDIGGILLYNAFHLVVSLAIGQVVTHLVAHADEVPERGPLVLGVLVTGFLVTVLVVGQLTAPMRPLLPWWSIVWANVAAVVVAGGWLARKRPGGVRRLLRLGPDQD